MTSALTRYLEANDSDGELLETIVEELKTLHGNRLRMSISERKEKLEEITSKSKDTTLQTLNSPYTQYMFLTEHLLPHEIIQILSTLHPDHPFLDRLIPNIKKHPEYNPEILYAAQYITANACLAAPEKICEELEYSIVLLEKKVERLEKEIGNIKDFQAPDSEELPLTYLHLYRAYELLGKQKRNIYTPKAFADAEAAFTKAYDALDRSGYEFGFDKEELELDRIICIWKQGYFEEALVQITSFLHKIMDYTAEEIFEMSEEELDKLSDLSRPTAEQKLQGRLVVEDQIEFEELLVTTMSTTILMLLDYAQVLEKYHTAEAYEVYDAVAFNLDQLHERLAEGMYLQKDPIHPHEKAYLFCKGRYLRLGGKTAEANLLFDKLLDNENTLYADKIKDLRTIGKITYHPGNDDHEKPHGKIIRFPRSS